MPLIETGLVLLGKAVSSKLFATGAGSLAAAGVLKAGSGVAGKVAAAGAAKMVAAQTRAVVAAKLGPAAAAKGTAGVKTVGGKVLEKGIDTAVEQALDKAKAVAKDTLVPPGHGTTTADDNLPKVEAGEQPSR
jgi:hypothetical protein